MSKADQLTELLRERFASHEADVPTGAWEAISEQLDPLHQAADLRGTLQEKFHDHAVDVDASAWARVSRQLGHGSGSTGKAARWWIAAGIGTVAIALTLLVANRTNEQAAPVMPEQGLTEHTTTSQPERPTQEVVVQPSATPVKEAPGTPVPGLSTRTAPARSAPSATRARPLPATSGSTTQAPHAAEADAPLESPDMGLAEEADMDAAEEVHEGTPEAAAAQTPVAPQPDGPIVDGSIVEDAPTAAVEKVVGSSPEHPAEEVVPSVPLIGQASADSGHGTASAMQVWIPDVFTPQGDGLNDELKIIASGYSKVEVRVINTQTGATVFETNDLSIQWDGRLPNGNIAEEGQYLCVVMLSDASGTTKYQSREVRLYR